MLLKYMYIFRYGKEPPKYKTTSWEDDTSAISVFPHWLGFYDSTFLWGIRYQNVKIVGKS